MRLRTLVSRLTLLAAIGTGAAHASAVSASNDQQITRQVNRLISQHPEFGSMLTVQTHHGVVYLGGTPWTFFAMSNLELLVRQTEGVADVVVSAVFPGE